MTSAPFADSIEPPEAVIEMLVQGVRKPRAVVLTGAGCSTESGIPDYRSPGGLWSLRKPVLYQEFLRSSVRRQFYWARSYSGWNRFRTAEPNAGHLALSEMERMGHISLLVTQNVDRLHHRAGSREVIELHGRNDLVVCVSCGYEIARDTLQDRLSLLNAGWKAPPSLTAPDGDADLTVDQTTGFVVSDCEQCGGIVKPAVVFFGESVPRGIVASVMQRVQDSGFLLVVGSSLTVWSGYRFVKAAAEKNIPIAILNIGPTRADGLASWKIETRCGDLLPRLAERLRSEQGG